MGRRLRRISKAACQEGGLSLEVGGLGLICPFALKYCFNLRVGVARLYIDLIHAGRLFFFQLNRIVLEADQQPAAAPAGNGSRWQRALRLVCRGIITHARRSPPALEFDVASFHTLTMLSL
ncbi:hypothetical protein Godav_021667 [Gossypium davidsonii]|uniref:Uncharacterized protein n=1 Tax=Gossypium davidsonii TaxID=34287 RepID=A0A7J8R7B2_GOSDV|nr:hypothetical protein [Gossypium davidsonii]